MKEIAILAAIILVPLFLGIRNTIKHNREMREPQPELTAEEKAVQMWYREHDRRVRSYFITFFILSLIGFVIFLLLVLGSTP